MTRRTKVTKTSLINCQDVKCDVKVVKHFDTKNNRKNNNNALDAFPEIKVFVDNVQKELVNAENKFYQKCLKRSHDKQLLQRKHVMPKSASVPKTSNLVKQQKTVNLPKPKSKFVRSLPIKNIKTILPKQDNSSSSSTTLSTLDTTRVLNNSPISSRTIVNKYYSNKLKDEIDDFRNTNILKENIGHLKISKFHNKNTLGLIKTIKQQSNSYSENLHALKDEISRAKNNNANNVNADLVNDIKSEIDKYRNAPLIETKSILSKSPCDGDWHCGNGELYSYIAVIKSADSKEKDKKSLKEDIYEKSDKENEKVPCKKSPEDDLNKSGDTIVTCINIKDVLDADPEKSVEEKNEQKPVETFSKKKKIIKKKKSLPDLTKLVMESNNNLSANIEKLTNAIENLTLAIEKLAK